MGSTSRSIRTTMLASLIGAARMRGHDDQAAHLFSYVSPEQRVPADHPLRAIRQMTDRVLVTLSQTFARMYSDIGRPSIPPEKLLRALLLQLLYSVRSERLLVEQLDYNLLFRWFVGLSMDDAVWDASTFSKNRERMLEGDIAEAFFQGVLGEARAGQLLSDEPFTVDGTLLEAWASHKSFRPVDSVGKDNDQEPKPPAARWDENNPTVNYRGEKRTNQTHCSTTDPQAMLARKGPGKEAKLSYHGHLMTENRSGLVVNTQATTAYDSAECHAGLLMAEQLPGCGRVTLGADKGYDQGRRRSRLDQRTTRHPGYEISQRKRKRIEEVFGWMKTVGMLRQLRHRGLERVGWVFTLAAATYNLVRMRTLMPKCV